MDESIALRRERPRLLARVPFLANRWVVATVLLAAAGVLVPVGLWARDNHPDGLNRSGTERRISHVFGRPFDGVDDKVVGDILVERFYAVDVETGQRMVADLVKGRVRQVQTWTNEYGTAYHTLVVERDSMQGHRAALRDYVRQLAPFDATPSVIYAGLAIQPGPADAMSVNFTGTLPVGHEPLWVPEGRTFWDALLQVKIADLQAPQFWSNRGYNYLLSSSELWPYFSTAFNVKKAVWVSEQVLVDATSPDHRLSYYRRIGGS